MGADFFTYFQNQLLIDILINKLTIIPMPN